MPVIGFLAPTSAQVSVKHLEAFRKGLSENGYVEGGNVVIEFRWAGGRDDRAGIGGRSGPRQVAVIVAPASTAAALAAKAATSSLPIVFGIGSDPVELVDLI
jgi:putative ABC transport system substrate-binding protein